MVQVKFNDKAKQVLADTLDLSGSIVVTELPKVGEEHTVYELQETKVADFPWLLTEIDDSKGYPFPKLPLLVVENEENVTYENLKIRSFEANQHIGVYVKATNKVYGCMWEYAEIGEPGDQDYTFIKEEAIQKDNIYSIEKTRFVILKDFDYHSTSGEESDTLDGTGHFLDGTEIDYEDYLGIVPLVLTDATDKKIILDNKAFIGMHDATDEELPPSVIEVNKIDLSLLGKEVVFVPQPSKQVSTYWIYTNNNWFNVDDIKPTLHKTVYGTLTDVDGSTELACSISYDEIVNTFENGDVTILEYKPTEGDDYYYCAIIDAQWGEGDNPTITLNQWTLGYGGIRYSTSRGFYFDNGAE